MSGAVESGRLRPRQSAFLNSEEASRPPRRVPVRRPSARSACNKRKEKKLIMSTRGMHSPIVRFCFSLIIVLLCACGALAQSTTDGAIGGTVTDSSGAAVPNAKVVVKSNGTNAEEIAMTDDTGYFRVGKLQPATYTVTVDVPGFAPFKAERVVVQVGSITDIS